jgi:hypothetical protein
MEVTAAISAQRHIGRSTAAILFGLAAGAVLSLGTDQVLHVLKVYPPWNEPMYDTRLNLLALSYRMTYDTFGSYLAARFAPRNPMRHALILGAIGLVPSVAGVIAATTIALGPLWYPIVLAVSVMPTAWLGGQLHRISSR